MRLGGRLEGAISVLADIDARKRPVADALKDWGLAHRFAGSGDRAAIGNIVYDALRMRLSHAWLMDDDSPAAIAHAVMFRQWGFTSDSLATELADDKFAPAPLSADAVAAFQTRSLDDAPPHIRGDIPEWVQPSFEQAFGAGWLAEAQALPPDRRSICAPTCSKPPATRSSRRSKEPTRMLRRSPATVSGLPPAKAPRVFPT